MTNVRLLFLLIGFSILGPSLFANSRPNILFCISDDQATPTPEPMATPSSKLLHLIVSQMRAFVSPMHSAMPPHAVPPARPSSLANRSGGSKKLVTFTALFPPNLPPTLISFKNPVTRSATLVKVGAPVASNPEGVLKTLPDHPSSESGSNHLSNKCVIPTTRATSLTSLRSLQKKSPSASGSVPPNPTVASNLAPENDW